MEKNSETRLLTQICKSAKAKGKLTGRDLTRLVDAFGERFLKAFEAIKENRVKKYVFKPSNRVVWIVVGKGRDYLIFPDAGFCSCDDFYFRVLDREVHLCYHLIAREMGETLGWYDCIEERDELYEQLMDEWRKVSV
jgi:predicted nucleic acid-binding Zn finger protein